MKVRAASFAALMRVWPPASLVIMEPEESKTTIVGAIVVELEGVFDVDGLGGSTVLSSAAATGKNPATMAIAMAARVPSDAVNRDVGEKRGAVFM